MATLTKSVKTAEGYGHLMTLTVAAVGGDIDPCVFLIRRLSSEEDDTDFIAVCSYADMENYGTTPGTTPYRVATITIMAATSAKATEMWTAVKADVESNFTMQIDFADLLGDETLDYNDDTDTAGPFVFGDPGALP